MMDSKDGRDSGRDLEEKSPGQNTTMSVDSDQEMLGAYSCIVEGKTGLGNKEEASMIHKENVAKLSSMSHEDILKERDALMNQLSPEKIQFIQSLRKKKVTLNVPPESEAQVTSDVTMEETTGKGEASSSTLDKGEAMEISDPNPETESSAESQPESQRKFGRKKSVSFAEDIEVMEIESILPISPIEAKKWVNMDKVELEKLKWLSDIPSPKPLKSNEGFVARFNFEGDLLPYDAQVSVKQGLHHHGEEPGRAGYTLDELFILMRSSVVQQRHVGTRTIANIIRNAKEGLYDGCLDVPIIQLMVEAGLVLLLRFGLDESSALVYVESMRGMYYLLTSEGDENCLDLLESWGGTQPGVSSAIFAQEKAQAELEEEEKELKDIEILQLDIIRALVRMDTLVRLRYMMESIELSAETVVHVLGILTRVTRHSLTAAWKVAQTPGLLQVVVKHFLPHDLSPLLQGQNVNKMECVYGVPLRAALKLIKVLAARGRGLAALLVKDHLVMERLLAYVSVEPSSMGMPRQEALVLSQEAYALWSVLLAYGLPEAQEAVTSFFPYLVKQLVFYRDRVDVNQEEESNKFNYDVGAALVHTMYRAVNVAATHSLLVGRVLAARQSQAENEDVLQSPHLTWDHIKDLPPLVETCLTKWLVQLARTQTLNFSSLRLIGSCCQFMSSFLAKWKDQKCYSGVEAQSAVEHIYNEILNPFLQSSFFNLILESFIQHSGLLSNLSFGTQRDPRNLGSLGCICYGGKVNPVLSVTSPWPLMLPLTQLLLQLLTLHPTLPVSTVHLLTNNSSLQEYLQKVCTAPKQLAAQWLSKSEVNCLCNIVYIASVKGSNNPKLFHSCALALLPCIHTGDEQLIRSLLQNVVNAKSSIADLTELSASVGTMALENYEPLASPAIMQPILAPLQLTNTVAARINSICSHAVDGLLPSKVYKASAVLRDGVPFLTNGLTIDTLAQPLAISPYWPLQQVLNRYRLSLVSGQEKQNEPNQSDQSSPEVLLHVGKSLQMTYLLLRHRRDTVFAATTVTGWIRHLSLVFLAANDFFLDHVVSSYLQGCLVEVLQKGGSLSFNENEVFTSLGNCFEWYKAMMSQFTSVSYGDSTFALFLILPVQRHWPSQYRDRLWGENSDALSQIRLTSQQVEKFIPLTQFRIPEEENINIIQKYEAGIRGMAVQPSTTPFLYAIAHHHVTQWHNKHNPSTE
ncbi:RNA polymerase II-associated protein 1 isoform X2 [Oratosquilla oratoria]